ncbi:transcriptional regulator [Roseburia hominis]
MKEKRSIQIRPGFCVGKLTVTEATPERKNGYTIWRCTCECGRSICLDTRTLKRGIVRDCGCETVVKPGQRDITGQRFGKLTALYPTEKRGRDGSLIWHCRCDCGGEVDAPLHQLSAGYRKSCGCLSRPPLKDFVGKRFGKLVVQKYAGKWKGLHHWQCICDCGNETIAGQTALQSGKTKSCGCLGNPPAKDILGRQFGDLTVIAYDGKREGTYFWRCQCKCGNETVVQQNNLLLGHTKSCGCRQKTVYKENLKLIDGTSVTMLEASRQHRLISTNSSGYGGVYRKRKSGKWAAQITFKGKTYYLGSFIKIEDAVKARKEAEESIYGEFLKWYYEVYLEEEKTDAIPSVESY